MLLAIHATAGADEDKPPAEGEPSAEPAKPAKLCMRNQKLEQLAGQLAELQHIPPSPELIRKAREAGVDANPLYAKFGVTGEFDSFKTWLENLDEAADAPLICGRARYAERIVLVAAVRAGSLELVGKNGIHAEVIEDFRDPYLVVRDAGGASRRISIDGGGIRSDHVAPTRVAATALHPAGGDGAERAAPGCGALGGQDARRRTDPARVTVPGSLADATSASVRRAHVAFEPSAESRGDESRSSGLRLGEVRPRSGCGGGP